MYKWIDINTNADYMTLVNLLDPEFGPKKVAERLSDRISNAVKGILVEFNYVDKDYRSTYYHFYAKKGQRYRPDCVRLHFFDGAASLIPLTPNCPAAALFEITLPQAENLAP